MRIFRFYLILKKANTYHKMGHDLWTVFFIIFSKFVTLSNHFTVINMIYYKLLKYEGAFIYVCIF